MSHGLSHINAQGYPAMVNVGKKEATSREARARALVTLPAQFDVFAERETQTAKGPVIATAILAGTMAAKRTADLIPLCHPLALTSIAFDIQPRNPHILEIVCTVACNGQTGVEMEALTGATVAALTVYDMCKALTHEITLGPIELLSKTGGKRGHVAQDSI